MATLWIDRAAVIEPDGGGFKITGFSGDQVFTLQIARHLLRRFCEESRRALDRAEAEDAQRLIAFTRQPADGKGRPAKGRKASSGKSPGAPD